jgi:hypothetical protein
MSETSPPKPTTARELNSRRRLTSVKRAREPYDARISLLDVPTGAASRGVCT